MTQEAVIQRVAAAAGEFVDAAPGHRFNLYFPLWRDDWGPDNQRKKDAIEACTHIRQRVAELLDAVRDRQEALFSTCADGMCIRAVSTAPFATGLGNEHPVENGFAFLAPYGLPYLAGSGVKGVLRRAAEELALFPEDFGRQDDLALTLLDVWWLFGFEGAGGAWWPLSRKEQQGLSDEAKAGRDALRGCFLAHMDALAERPDLQAFICRAIPPGEDRTRCLANPRSFLDQLDERRSAIHTRGALSFWDVFPRPPSQGPCKDRLAVEIMTPHYTDYYQRGGTPNDAGQPTPIPFLAVPPESLFDFHVVCSLRHIPEALRASWQPLLQSIFAHAFDWLGFGAKTAVGYGALRRDQEREEKAQRDQQERLRQSREAAEARRLAQEKAAARAAMDPAERSIHAFLDARPNKNESEISALIGAMKQGHWQGEEKIAVARWLKAKMQATKGMWKESSQAKKPEKDREYQNTLLVMKWLES